MSEPPSTQGTEPLGRTVALRLAASAIALSAGVAALVIAILLVKTTLS